MATANRILADTPVATLEAYLAVRGGAALEAARGAEPSAVVAEIEASGLRGRGGAGFPTGKKWRTILEAEDDAQSKTVIVNGAEGEPGTFKDRCILRNNPYQVVEGALIAASVVGADEVIFAVKANVEEGVERLQFAVKEVCAAGWATPDALTIFEGPVEYLYGEETALLEVLEGRPPFPRVTPPFRRGLDEQTVAPPALIDNLETIANIPGIVLNGAAWFREVGTEKSPGTIVCTISGGTVHAGVDEIPMGTTLREAIKLIGGGVPEGREIKAVLPGVSTGFIPAAALDTELTYEAMAQIGSGLGSAGFIVFTEDDDLTAVTAGASRFLAVESCGQCTPCKRDGLALASLLERVAASDATDDDLAQIHDLVSTVSDEARCSLAIQHQTLVTSLLDHFGRDVAAHVDGTAPAVETIPLVAEFTDVRGGRAYIDENQANKQPDWTYDETDSGKYPVDRLIDHRETA